MAVDERMEDGSVKTRVTGNRTSLSVVIPVYNEEENVAPLFAEIQEALHEGFHYEVIYVDDGSEDDTAGQLLKISSGSDRVRVVRHTERCGQSTAILTGVREATSPWVATLDGDGQNDPADIPRLWKTLMEQPQGRQRLMVVGYRKKRRDTALKRMSSRIANAVRSYMLRDNTPDTGSGLKVFGRDLFLELPYFDHMHRFLPALVLRSGGRVVSVEVSHRERARGTSKYGVLDRLWVGIVDLMGVFWLQRRSKLPTIERKE